MMVELRIILVNYILYRRMTGYVGEVNNLNDRSIIDIINYYVGTLG